jgi:hypothetical protein
MVSGAIGGFLDVAFNFNTLAFLDDNLLGLFKSFYSSITHVFILRNSYLVGLQCRSIVSDWLEIGYAWG